MKVCIYSNNAQVNTALVSMCASCGCKVQKLLKYDKDLLKGSDMVLIDLDNCSDSKDILEDDIQDMTEIVFIGISKDLDILDNYRGIMNVERKPFSNKVFKHYKDLVFKRLESTIVITKEENRIYDEFGINLGATFSNSNIAIEDRLSVLKKAIQEKSNYDNEEVFLKKIGLGDIEYREKKKIPLPVIDIQKEINTDPIIKYRIRKLKMMNLSNKDIDSKINDFINSNINTSITRPKMSNNEKDILSKLREQGQKSQRFRDKKNQAEQTKIAAQSELPIIEKPEVIKEPPMKKITTEEPVKKAEPVETNKTVEIPREPPTKKDNPFKKPIVTLGGEFKNDKVDETSEKEDKTAFSEEKKEIKNPPTKKPAFLKPQLLIGDDDNENVDTPKEPPRKIDKEPVVPISEDDSLAKFREDREKRKKQIEERRAKMMSNTDSKTNTENIKTESIIKDNNEDLFGTSLVDRMQEQIGYYNRHQKPKKETAFEIASKKSKPPR